MSMHVANCARARGPHCPPHVRWSVRRRCSVSPRAEFRGALRARSSRVRDFADAEFSHFRSSIRTPHSGGWSAGGVTLQSTCHTAQGRRSCRCSGCGTLSALRFPPARRAARSVPRATIDVGDRGMALPHIREDCAWTQGSHHTHQWLVSAWGILNFSSSIIVWRSTGLFRAGVSDLCQTFLHRLHVAT